MDYKYLYDKYSKDGFIKVEEFFTESEVSTFIRGVHEIMERIPTEEVLAPFFRAPKNQFDEYYLNSGDKIEYFFGPDAFNDAGTLTASDIKDAVTRVGYALHWWNPQFKKMTFCEKIKDLLKNFGCKNPVVIDSQLTFKKSKPDEVSHPHQISTFLYTNPPSALGIWIPLKDADIETGCLWFLPGSHKGEIFQRFVKNPDDVSLMMMKGKIPEIDSSSYVPVPVKKGDLVLMNGSVLHKCGRNICSEAHVSYSFHTAEEDAEWSAENWLQPSERLPFPSVYAN